MTATTERADRPDGPDRPEAAPDPGRRPALGPAALRRAGLALAAPVLALVFSLAVSAVALLISGSDPLEAYAEMADYVTQPASVVAVVNRAVPLFLSGLAVAIGFRAGLFNIGVEGQYRLAALLAAGFAASVSLPRPLHLLATVLVAMAVGALWAGVAGVLRTRRGVSEVISTLLLNIVAGSGIVAYLLNGPLEADNAQGDLVTKTDEIPQSGRFPSLDPLLESLGLELPRNASIGGFLVVAVLVGVGFHLLIERTRFGYDLRASGLNATAARAAGVEPRAMVVRTMLLSGAVAGLVGLPQLLQQSFRFSLDFPTGLGFLGIAVALLGRNRPVGIALAALLFAVLDRSSQVLDLIGVPKEIVTIMQGVIVLAVVVAYEVVRRASERSLGRAVAERTAQQEGAA